MVNEQEFLEKAGVSADAVKTGFVTPAVREQLAAVHGNFVVDTWLHAKETDRKMAELAEKQKEKEAKETVKDKLMSLRGATPEEADAIIDWAKENTEDWVEIERALIEKSATSQRLLRGLLADFDKAADVLITPKSTPPRKNNKVEVTREVFQAKIADWYGKGDGSVTVEMLKDSGLADLLTARFNSMKKGA
jgi:hydroxymethylpyrimidine/phosphomethylpyrimidine kinase